MESCHMRRCKSGGNTTTILGILRNVWREQTDVCWCFGELCFLSVDYWRGCFHFHFERNLQRKFYGKLFKRQLQANDIYFLIPWRETRGNILMFAGNWCPAFTVTSATNSVCMRRSVNTRLEAVRAVTCGVTPYTLVRNYKPYFL